MKTEQFFIYLAIMALTTYLIRVIPFVLIKKKIENKFVKSFLFYIPYTVLASMTFPAAVYATDSVYAGGAGLITAVICSAKGAGLTKTAVFSCVAVLIINLLIH